MLHSPIFLILFSVGFLSSIIDGTGFSADFTDVTNVVSPEDFFDDGTVPELYTEDGVPAKNGYLGPTDIVVSTSGDFLYVLESDVWQLRRVRLSPHTNSDTVANTSREQKNLSWAKLKEPFHQVFLPQRHREHRENEVLCELCVSVVHNKQNDIAVLLTNSSALLKMSSAILPLNFRPERFCLFDNDRKIAVVGGGVCGQLAVADVETFTILGQISLGHTPCDVAVGIIQQTEYSIFACNRFDGTLSVVSCCNAPESHLLELREIRRIAVGREPIGVAATPDGKKVVVANHQPEVSSLDPRIACAARIVYTDTFDTHELTLRNGVINIRGVTVEPMTGKYGFLTAQIGHFEQIPSHVDGGWVNENVLLAVNLDKDGTADVIHLDDFGHGAANPWGVSFDETGRFLVVSHTGSHEISVLNYTKIRHILDRNRDWPYHLPVDESLPFQLRMPVSPRGLRQLTMFGDTIYYTGYFHDMVGRCVLQIGPTVEYIPGYVTSSTWPEPIALPDELLPNDWNHDGTPLVWQEQSPLNLMKGITVQRQVASLGPRPRWTPERWGEMLFQDGNLCYEQWQTCISCHPDGRADSLNWDLMNDGTGNPKNTKSMLWAHETPPAMITGVRSSAEVAVRSGIHSILFTNPVEQEAAAIDRYLRSLRPVPSPYLVNGKLSESAQRGKRLFFADKTGCADCHPAPFYTDLMRHDVNTHGIGDVSGRYDTPTLVEVWRTSPYLHDGRYTTMSELLRVGKHGNSHSQLDTLTDTELDDLCEFVLSL